MKHFPRISQIAQNTLPMLTRFCRKHFFLAVLGSTFLFANSAACAPSQVAPPASQAATPDAQLQQLQTFVNSDVVYLGEQHDSEADHAAQLDIIQAMHTKKPDLAIALEMFQRPFQPAIDRYLAGEISEAELVEQTEYLERWGFPWEYYAPIIRFAQKNQLPVLALNAPAEIVRQVARQGLASLEGDDFRYIPPLADIDTGNTDYQAFVAAAFGSHGSHGNFNFDNFFAAQVVWDETMAETVAEFKQMAPDTTVVVLAGNAHVIHGYGIPDRVARRLAPSLQQTKVLLNFPEEFLTEESDGIADVLWYSE